MAIDLIVAFLVVILLLFTSNMVWIHLVGDICSQVGYVHGKMMRDHLVLSSFHTNPNDRGLPPPFGSLVSIDFPTLPRWENPEIGRPHLHLRMPMAEMIRDFFAETRLWDLSIPPLEKMMVKVCQSCWSKIEALCDKPVFQIFSDKTLLSMRSVCRCVWSFTDPSWRDGI